MPDTKLGTTVNTFLKLKQKISKKNKEVDDLKSQASELEKEIIKELEATKTERTDVKLGSVTFKKEPVYNVKDWKKVWAYIFKHKDTSLVQKRLSQAAIKEMIEDGVKIGGLEKMIKKSLRVGFKRSV